MILKLLFALIFTNIIGIIYDMIRAEQSDVYEKRYVNSILGIISMIFFKNIAECFFRALFGIRSKIFLVESIVKIFEIIIFVFTIFYLIDYQHEIRSKELIHLGIVGFVFWSIAYSYISVTSNSLYLNDNKKTERELKMLEGIASKSDKIILFFLNLILSPLTVHMYILALITTAYAYLIGNWVDNNFKTELMDFIFSFLIFLGMFLTPILTGIFKRLIPVLYPILGFILGKESIILGVGAILGSLINIYNVNKYIRSQGALSTAPLLSKSASIQLIISFILTVILTKLFGLKLLDNLNYLYLLISGIIYWVILSIIRKVLNNSDNYLERVEKFKVVEKYGSDPKWATYLYFDDGEERWNETIEGSWRAKDPINDLTFVFETKEKAVNYAKNTFVNAVQIN